MYFFRWFKPGMIRPAAESLLSRVRKDGVFLIRNSTRPPHVDLEKFTLSFRAARKVRHCKISYEGELFSVSSRA